MTKEIISACLVARQTASASKRGEDMFPPQTTTYFSHKNKLNESPTDFVYSTTYDIHISHSVFSQRVFCGVIISDGFFQFMRETSVE